ncbi:MAG: 5-formyltetrahydrofolate cyclo-ligase [Planctomycetes bacterium]|nr:5-formyltetrahydrofolate cyclo-ligase [Planctomycetota bacterium]
MPAATKNDLREAARLARRAMPAARRKEAARQIVEQFLTRRVIQTADAFFVYVSYRDEVTTHDLIRRLLADGKMVAVPKILNTKRMIAIEIGSLDDLVKSEHGMLEPPGELSYHGPIEVCVTPGLAFTESGERLGYGRGYYDRFLARYKKTLCVAPAFECQIVKHIPTEPHDRTMDLIVTESRVIRVS